MKTKLALAGVALAVGATLTACGSSNTFLEKYQDANVANRDESPADIITMPDGFPNVSSKCYKGFRIFVTRGDGSSANTGRDISVVADPTCPK